ncbi:leucine-rich melanocyte differentiation-associated protein isoform X2 [Folsomia candida]|uniref:leucine-rich melanocyte differentiation-associated protein isoform X2 n=1 Tax=Folsomia candida TaxID=158441 RepID=UPI000B908FAF|nr:leucine-rich melanocyte differentiation-associated protein isoform X2 [Folsomia candida]
MQEASDDPDFSEICFVGGDLTEFNVRRFGPDVRRVDVSFNTITRLGGFECCADNLEELILDNNQLDGLELICVFPKLHTLSLNKNKISNLKKLLHYLKTSTPSLRYLSLLGNPTCPDQLTDDFVDDSDYQIYRYHVLYHLRTLKFLDHRPVSFVEMMEALKPLYAGGPQPPQGQGHARSRQGKRKFKYLGKNSEGNRFIRDNDL